MSNSIKFKEEKISVGPFGEEIIPTWYYPVPKETIVHTIGALNEYGIMNDVWLEPAKISNPAGKNKIVVATDSFFNKGGIVRKQNKSRKMLPLCLQAKEAIALHYELLSYDTMKLLGNIFKPDFVLEEHAEVQLQYANNRRQPLEVVILGEKKIGNLQCALTPDMLSDVTEKVNVETIKNSDGTITLKTKGDYNYIAIPQKIKTNKDGYLAIAANLSTPSDTVTYISYRIPGKTWLSTRLFAQKGGGLLYFQVTATPNTEYEFRFSPGYAEAQYTLKDLPFLKDIK